TFDWNERVALARKIRPDVPVLVSKVPAAVLTLWSAPATQDPAHNLSEVFSRVARWGRHAPGEVAGEVAARTGGLGGARVAQRTGTRYFVSLIITNPRGVEYRGWVFKKYSRSA